MGIPTQRSILLSDVWINSVNNTNDVLVSQEYFGIAKYIYVYVMCEYVYVGGNLFSKQERKGLRGGVGVAKRSVTCPPTCNFVCFLLTSLLWDAGLWPQLYRPYQPYYSEFMLCYYYQ